MKFADVLEIKNGRNQRQVECVDGRYPIYGSGGVMGRANSYICEANAVVIGRKGNINNPIFVDEPFWNVDTAFGLVPHADILLPKYLYYFCKSYNFEKLNTTVTIPSLTKLNLLQVEIDVPNLETQKERVNILDGVEYCYGLLTKEAAQLDELVKSRFVEMFGNPIKNTQNRPMTIFADVVTMQRGFDLPVQDRQQDGTVPVYGSNGVLGHHNIAKVHGGGVITGRSGTIGKVFYAEGDFWPLNTSLFSVNTHGNNIVYLAYLLQMYNLSRFTEGTGVPTLNRNKFHGEQIIDIPRSEQDSFAAFVAEVDKSKFCIQKSLVASRKLWTVVQIDAIMNMDFSTQRSL